MISEPSIHFSWYVLHAKPRRELLVASLLDRAEAVTVFLPEVKQRIRGESRLTPLFPGYLFVQADLRQVPTTLLSHTPGVIGLVGSERQPLAVADDVVERLQQRVDALNAQGGLRLHRFQPGDQVRVSEGPLQGLDAVFVGPLEPADRVRILLHFLGRQQELLVDVSLLEKGQPVAPAQIAARPRRTRGHGRRIRVGA